MYFAGMFFVTAGYHRYFAHRTYKTSRGFQLVLAVCAQATAQRGVLWWAAHHRRHHRYSDQPMDVHSPVQRGFWYSHVGWIYAWNSATDYARVRDLGRYPELCWLNRNWLVPPVVLGVATFLWGGWPLLLGGFGLGLVLLWHGTFTINSLAHRWGTRAFNTDDDSRNNPWLAILTLGEGWHNNHHQYMHSVRQGFLRREVDVTYWLLRALAIIGLVWDLCEPPPELLGPVAKQLD
jgi:stearoyl-CoA desaturase (delta-9 desaturase)